MTDMLFSASRIETWLSCKRLAGFVYFLGLRSEGTVDTEFGGAVHKTLENWEPKRLPEAGLNRIWTHPSKP